MITLKDVVTLAETVSTGYGDTKLRILGDVEALFLLGSGRGHYGNVEINESDAHVYLDINNPILTDRGYRLEGLLVLANPFNGVEDKSWYKITRVKVGQRKLLDNDVDNVHAFLKATAKKEVVS